MMFRKSALALIIGAVTVSNVYAYDGATINAQPDSKAQAIQVSATNNLLNVLRVLKAKNDMYFQKIAALEKLVDQVNSIDDNLKLSDVIARLRTSSVNATDRLAQVENEIKRLEYIGKANETQAAEITKLEERVTRVEEYMGKLEGEAQDLLKVL